jgi:uncharacterized CHY-type Zn-finger protein
MSNGPQAETATETAAMGRKLKICRDVECEEKYNKLTDDARTSFLEFSYCPFCSNELVILCSSCRESLSDKDYNFCPWCGCQFEK